MAAQSPVITVLALGVIAYAAKLYLGKNSGPMASATPIQNRIVTLFGGQPQPVKTGQVSTATPYGVTDAQAGSYPGTAPAGAGQIATNLIHTTLTDFGGFPVVFDPSQNTMIQDPAQGGTNAYGPGDIFQNVGGEQWVYQGGTSFISQASGDTWQLVHFEA